MSTSRVLKEARVPSSRIGRLLEFGGLASGMAYGAAGEGIRRILGSSKTTGSLAMTAGNVNLLVRKLSKMRGAALKLGQMMSFQGQQWKIGWMLVRDYDADLVNVDSKLLPGPISEILQQVQDSANYMPADQLDQVMSSNLGNGWQSLFSSFDRTPIAAASIGQVHSARLAGSEEPVAVKVQYPGVADSITADLSNLSILLHATRLLPPGLYLDRTIENARVELAWECDYVREAQCCSRFRHLLSDEATTFIVPRVYDEASGPQVLTAEMVRGTAVTQLLELSQQDRDWIGEQMLRLCLREITEFKFMQTDPNWTNFLFNSRDRRIGLLDFGASRDYPERFISLYVRILQAASIRDRESIKDLSVELGYLTGFESSNMINAHIDSVLILAEPFRQDQESKTRYDFGDQTITQRIRDLVPVMLRDRLAPPPEETYSLHRKLSGAFLMCARLRSRINCKDMFEHSMARYSARLEADASARIHSAGRAAEGRQ